MKASAHFPLMGLDVSHIVTVLTKTVILPMAVDIRLEVHMLQTTVYLVCNLLLIYNFMWNVVDITSSEDPNTSLIGLDYKIVSTEVLNPKFQTSERKDDFNQTSMRTSIPVLTYPCRLYSYWREFRRFSRFTLILQQLFNS